MYIHTIKFIQNTVTKYCITKREMYNRAHKSFSKILHGNGLYTTEAKKGHVQIYFYFVRTTYYFVLTKYYLVPTKYYFLRTTYYFVPTKYYFVRTKYYLVPPFHPCFSSPPRIILPTPPPPVFVQSHTPPPPFFLPYPHPPTRPFFLPDLHTPLILSIIYPPVYLNII